MVIKKGVFFSACFVLLIILFGFLQFSSAYSSSCDANLIAFWKFDEPVGATRFYDGSVNNINLICSENSCPTANRNFASFGGTNPLNSSGVDNFLMGKSGLTISLWAKTQQTSGWIYFVKQEQDGRGFYLSIKHPDNMWPVWEFWGGIKTSGFSEWTEISSSITPNVNEWNNYAMTWDGTNLKLYLNGSLVATGSAQGTFDRYTLDLSKVMKIGMGNIQIANLSIWNRALSESEIGEVYNISWGICEKSRTCGNGFVEKGEDCDNGAYNGKINIPSNMWYNGTNPNGNVFTGVSNYTYCSNYCMNVTFNLGTCGDNICTKWSYIDESKTCPEDCPLGQPLSCGATSPLSYPSSKTNPLPTLSSIPPYQGFYGRYYNFNKSDPSGDFEINPLPQNSFILPSIGTDNPFRHFNWYSNDAFVFERYDYTLNNISWAHGFYPVNINPNSSKNGGNGNPDPLYFAVKWTACVNVSNPGNYQFNVYSDDDAWVYLDGTLVGDLGGIHPACMFTGTMLLDTSYKRLTIFFAERHSTESRFLFNFTYPGVNIIPWNPFISQCDQGPPPPISSEDRDCINSGYLGSCEEYNLGDQACTGEFTYKVCTTTNINGLEKKCWQNNICSSDNQCHYMGERAIECGPSGAADCVWTISSCDDTCHDDGSGKMVMSCTYTGNNFGASCTQKIVTRECNTEFLPFFSGIHIIITLCIAGIAYLFLRRKI